MLVAFFAAQSLTTTAALRHTIPFDSPQALAGQT